MNGKGRSSDNIAVKRFFRSLKHEAIYLKRYQTIREARGGIKDYRAPLKIEKKSN